MLSGRDCHNQPAIMKQSECTSVSVSTAVSTFINL